jgi:hypothetical protein
MAQVAKLSDSTIPVGSPLHLPQRGEVDATGEARCVGWGDIKANFPISNLREPPPTRIAFALLKQFDLPALGEVKTNEHLSTWAKA